MFLRSFCLAFLLLAGCGQSSPPAAVPTAQPNSPPQVQQKPHAIQAGDWWIVTYKDGYTQIRRGAGPVGRLGPGPFEQTTAGPFLTLDDAARAAGYPEATFRPR